MEDSTVVSSTGNGPVITLAAEAFLRETGRWAKFIAIFLLVFAGLAIIFGFSFSAILSALPPTPGMNFPYMGVFGFIYVIVGAFYIIPAMYLLNFGTRVKKAFDSRDSIMLQSALENLKSHYKFVGILIIIMLSIYALFAVIGLVVYLVAR